eukprot:7111012-Prymnesium_polylepis.1
MPSGHQRRWLFGLCVRHVQHALALIAVRPQGDTALCDMLSYAQPPQDSSQLFAICLQIVCVRVREVLRWAIKVPTPRPPGVGGPGVATIVPGQVFGEPDPLARLLRHDLRLVMLRLFLRLRRRRARVLHL